MSDKQKEKPLTKTELMILRRLQERKQPYGYQFRSDRKRPYTSVIEALIAKGMAHDPQKGKMGVLVNFAEITAEGRMALESAS